jgi:fatty-acyl-CoA synthase
VRPQRPDRLLRAGRALARWGATPAAGQAAAAARRHDAIGLVDEAGTLTFGQLHARSNALAHALREDGIRAGDRIAILCRNHRHWVDAYAATNKLGAHALLMNTAFSAPQLAEVAEREDAAAIIFDAEFAPLLQAAGAGRRRYVAWSYDGEAGADATVNGLIADGDPSDLDPPAQQGKAVILTSGTTGAPKGARRAQPQSLDPVAALLERIPLRARGRTMIAAPLFHSWGFTHFTLGLALNSTIVLRRRFDPEATLALTAQHGCEALVAVPVMLQRILDLPDAVLSRYDLSRVTAVPVSGSALPPSLSERWMDRFGENLYNLYGSTEVAGRRSPRRKTCVRPLAPPAVRRGAHRAALRRAGAEVQPGQTGRIFVGNELAFEGYTGGGGKDAIDGRLSSGDVGHFDADGRLFVDGRDDEMIVSGGENVFPAEVEELLAGHPAITEAAVFGVEDAEFGQRLKAVVVVRAGHELSPEDVRGHVKAIWPPQRSARRRLRSTSRAPRSGKVLKRSCGRLDPVVCSACPAHDVFELAAWGSPPARAGVSTSHVLMIVSRSAGSDVRPQPSSCRCASTSPHHGSGWALRCVRVGGRAVTAVRALPGAGAPGDRSRRRARGRAARTRRRGAAPRSYVNARRRARSRRAWTRDALAARRCPP